MKHFSGTWRNHANTSAQHALCRRRPLPAMTPLRPMQTILRRPNWTRRLQSTKFLSTTFSRMTRDASRHGHAAETNMSWSHYTANPTPFWCNRSKPKRTPIGLPHTTASSNASKAATPPQTHMSWITKPAAPSSKPLPTMDAVTS
jgi:hypothetical protein